MEPHEDMAHHGHLLMGNFHLVGLLSVVGHSLLSAFCVILGTTVPEENGSAEWVTL